MKTITYPRSLQPLLVLIGVLGVVSLSMLILLCLFFVGNLTICLLSHVSSVQLFVMEALGVGAYFIGKKLVRGINNEYS
jgi:uncharacterized membrane protein